MPSRKKRKEQHLPAASKNQFLKGSKPVSQTQALHLPIEKPYFALFFVLLISFIVYIPVFNNGFVNWDDEKYIQENFMIHSINLREIFSEYVMGNYHPFTMLIYSVEYHFFGLNAKGFHAVNLLIHLLNVILVYRAVLLLSDKTGVALIASLLFGIHPMHVESVAWASELKDLLYVFFFLASYICYLRYLKDQQRKFYFYCLLLFLLSLLSKAMAASLPMVLLLTDYFKGRKINRSALLEKIPFFALSIAFGVIAVFAQQSMSAIHIDKYTFLQRIIFASYSFIIYLVKLLLPVNLSAYYPYPIRSGASTPIEYYLFLILLSGFVALVFYSLRFTKKIIFGIGFFATTILLVLQLLPVGDAMMADRYSYLPSLGIFYLAGEGIVLLWNKKRINQRSRTPVTLLLGAALIFYSAKTYSQCNIWKNSLNLWNDVISRYQTIYIAYYNRGMFFAEENKNDEAINDFSKAIELKPDGFDAINNRAVYLEKENRTDEALSDYSSAIKLRPDYSSAYLNRGLLFANKKNMPQEALNDYNKAIELQPDYIKAYINRGIVMGELKRYDEALSDFNHAIALEPDNAEAYNFRGFLFENEMRYEEALKDYNKALLLKPDFDKDYYDRGSVLNKLNRYDEALLNFNKAIELNPVFAGAFYNRSLILANKKRYDDAINDLDKAIALQPGYADAYFNRGIIFTNENKYAEALNDFNKALQLQPNNGATCYSKGVAEYHLGKKENACSDFQHAMTLGNQEAKNAYLNYCH